MSRHTRAPMDAHWGYMEFVDPENMPVYMHVRRYT